MGVVVAARHEQLGFQVALKFMLPAALSDDGMKERFLREARAAGRLRSEHVARVMDFGTLENGAPYIVMEFLEGEDLQELASRVGRLAVHEASEYVLQACKAMAEAHAMGIVHRDLKPQNLFLTRRPDGTPLVKVLDFGISKLVGADAASLSMTSSQTMMGSPLYMAPEQIRSAKNVDARADIYSLGVILYQLTTGTTPVDADTLGELFERIFTQPTAPLRERCPEISEDFDALVMRCLAKEPAGRFATAGELAAQLAPFADPRRSSVPIVLRPSTPEGTAAQGISTTLGPAMAVSDPAATDAFAAKRSASLGWVVAGGIALLVGGAGALILRTQTHASAVPLPSPAALGPGRADMNATAAPEVPTALTTATTAPPVAAAPSLPVAIADAPSAPPSAGVRSRPAPPKAAKPAVAAPASARPSATKRAHAPSSADPFGSPD
jgi:serine/threonine-protein kinase